MFEVKYGLITAQKRQFQEDEPLFLIRAKDKLAPRTVRYYAQLCSFYGFTTKNRDLIEFGEQAKRIAVEMEAWQRQNPDRVKLPD